MGDGCLGPDDHRARGGKGSGQSGARSADPLLRRPRIAEGEVESVTQPCDGVDGASGVTCRGRLGGIEPLDDGADLEPEALTVDRLETRADGHRLATAVRAAVSSPATASDACDTSR